MALPRVPKMKDPDAYQFCLDLVKSVNEELSVKMSSRQAVGSFLLKSPNGSVYKVTVDNAGVLSQTLVHG